MIKRGPLKINKRQLVNNFKRGSFINYLYLPEQYENIKALNGSLRPGTIIIMLPLPEVESDEQLSKLYAKIFGRWLIIQSNILYILSRFTSICFIPYLNKLLIVI